MKPVIYFPTSNMFKRNQQKSSLFPIKQFLEENKKDSTFIGKKKLLPYDHHVGFSSARKHNINPNRSYVGKNKGINNQCQIYKIMKQLTRKVISPELLFIQLLLLVILFTSLQRTGDLCGSFCSCKTTKLAMDNGESSKILVIILQERTLLFYETDT